MFRQLNSTQRDSTSGNSLDLVQLCKEQACFAFLGSELHNSAPLYLKLFLRNSRFGLESVR